MGLVLAFEDAKINQSRHEADVSNGTIGGSLHTKFFGSREDPDLPHAALTQLDPGRVSGTHFHIVDQFQVIVGGKGKLGRHGLTSSCVHFSRAYTPYGPLVSDTRNPLTFFVMHAHSHPDWRSHHLPQAQDELKLVPDRQPWQITSSVTFPTPQSGTAAANIMLQAVPGIKDENGLAAYTLSMKPNAKAQAPDPSHGDGQYLVVVKGSLLHDTKEHKAPALVFVYPEDGPFQVHAGSVGLEAIVLNFRRANARTVATTVRRATSLKTWQCSLCAFVYDEAAGLPEEGIAPGTPWKDVPETWTCPDCSSSKVDFRMVEL